MSPDPFGYFEDTRDRWAEQERQSVQSVVAPLEARIAQLEAALNALSQQHMWHPEGGGCRCEAHKKAFELLKGTQYEDAQRRAKGWL